MEYNDQHPTARLNYEYRLRDLTAKYSHAASKLGVVGQEQRQHWRDELARIDTQLCALRAEYHGG